MNMPAVEGGRERDREREMDLVVTSAAVAAVQAQDPNEHTAGIQLYTPARFPGFAEEVNCSKPGIRDQPAHQIARVVCPAKHWMHVR